MGTRARRSKAYINIKFGKQGGHKKISAVIAARTVQNQSVYSFEHAQGQFPVRVSQDSFPFFLGLNEDERRGVRGGIPYGVPADARIHRARGGATAGRGKIGEGEGVPQ